MPAPDDPFVLHCLELIAPLGAARSRRMFGGHGLYLDDLFIAIVADHQLYLKTDAQCLADFQRAGGHAFCYETQGKQVASSYWSPPDDALDGPAMAAEWLRRAMGAALRARAAAPAPRPRRTRRTEPVPPKAPATAGKLKTTGSRPSASKRPRRDA